MPFTLRNKHVVLASASPRRKELLAGLGLKFDIEVADIDETIDSSGDLSKELVGLAKRKAEAVGNNRSGIVIAADTVVVLNDQILTKPLSQQDGYQMLKGLSGKIHNVLTGYYIVDRATGDFRGRCISTEVEFFDLDEALINWYLDQDEYIDKAGAYAIQGMGAILVKGINGSYSNVVGLPVEWVWRDMMELNF